MAIDTLKCDPRTQTLSKRLLNYHDTCSSALAALSAGNAIEMILVKKNLYRGLLLICIYGFGSALYVIYIIYTHYFSQDCREDVACDYGPGILAFDTIDALQLMCASMAAPMAGMYASPYVGKRVFVYWIGLSLIGNFLASVGHCTVEGNCVDIATWPSVCLAWIFVIYRQQYFVAFSLAGRHVCMYVCMLCVCVYIYTYISISSSLSCLLVDMYVRLYVCMYVRVYVCMYAHISASVHRFLACW
jgi:hypothetical protein